MATPLAAAVVALVGLAAVAVILMLAVAVRVTTMLLVTPINQRNWVFVVIMDLLKLLIKAKRWRTLQHR
jgi:hypothetical protein